MSQLDLDFGPAQGPGPERRGQSPESGGASSRPGVDRRLSHAPALVASLDEVARAGGRRRRILVARTQGEGKELVRQLALHGRSWVGFEVTTVRPLARRFAADRLAREGARVVDEFDEHAMVEQAIDEVVGREPASRAGLGRAGGAGSAAGSGRAGDGGAREGGEGSVRPFQELAEKTGFRNAVRETVTAMRLAGVRPQPRSGGSGFDKSRLVTSVLERYEALLRKGSCTDTAGVLAAAIAALATGEPNRLPPGAQMLLVPGLSSRGLTGRFLELLRRHGAHIIRGDPVDGIPVPPGIVWDAVSVRSAGSRLHAVGRSRHRDRAPDDIAEVRTRPTTPRIELFAAASIADELRGVLRRAVAMGARWDQVEIVASRAAVYGSALHAIAEPLGIPVTFAVGLPVERTKPGRVASAYFRWIESGFQESVFRTLIESGDVVAPRPSTRDGAALRHRPSRPPGGPRLARSLRRLRIGWGRDRYLDAIGRAVGNLDGARPRHNEDDESFRRRKKRWGDDLRALDAILRPVLGATPARDAPTSPALVAVGVRALLERTSPGTDTDETARQRLVHQLDRIAATVTRVTDFAAAVAIVRSYLEIRVPAPRAEGMAPWGSAPGHLYLTDLRHGGATGRPFTFVVGLDSAGLHGSLHEDPLLSDRERRRLGRGALPLAAERVAESRFGFAQLFARLRGAVVLSYARWNPAESRAVTPAPELLQALRLRSGDGRLGFADLDLHLGLAESRLPRQDVAADLDAGDVWLRALDAGGGRFMNGLDAVRAAHPRLDLGMAARDALRDASPSVHTGFLGPLDAGGTASDDPPNPFVQPIGPSPDRRTSLADDGSPTDPATRRPFVDPSARVFSAGALQTLGACPRRFLFRYVLRAYGPDDPEFDPERWLNAAERGSVLHSVYERTLRQAREQGLDPAEGAFMDIALEHVNRLGAEQLVQTPSPSDAVQGWEMEALREDARSFVGMIRDARPRWTEIEWKFGGAEGVEIGIGDSGTLRVRGIVDRVDNVGSDLSVVDYKTGSDYGYGWRSKVYDGGRRFQHFVYSAAVAACTGKEVVGMEYHFPTRRGEHNVRDYPAGKLADGGDMIALLLQWLRVGWFPATDQAREDCRFCDYGDLCGVREGAWGAVSSPFAEWTARNVGKLPELARLTRVRNWERR